VLRLEFVLAIRRSEVQISRSLTYVPCARSPNV
jgi:hypothetical protein